MNTRVTPGLQFLLSTLFTVEAFAFPVQSEKSALEKNLII